MTLPDDRAGCGPGDRRDDKCRPIVVAAGKVIVRKRVRGGALDGNRVVGRDRTYRDRCRFER
jgi:hypothetical protein